jgi:hypothetical protein
MHTEALSQAQVHLLEGLTTVGSVGDFYLAGGTAVALLQGHRRSIDFDFFREGSFDAQRLVRSLDRTFGPVERLSSGEQTLYLRVAGVTMSFFQLPYPLLGPTTPTPWNFGIASSPDLAAMKLEAIAGRGSRKDFVDLFWLCRSGMSLSEVFGYFERKYPMDRVERYHRVRALTYFDDAEAEPMLDLLKPLAWSSVREYFTREAKRFLTTELDRE